jgi:outer membrane lipoprotein-sorting protein
MRAAAPRAAAAIALALLAATAGRAQSTDAKTAALLRELGRASDAVHTLRARFVQEKHVAIVRDVLRSSGTFTLDKGGRITWDVTEPEPVRVVIRQDGVFAGGKRLTGEGAAASVSPVPMLQGMSGVFAGLSPRTADAFEVTPLGGDRLRLRPRSADLARWVAAIEITLDPKTKTPARVRIEEPGGDSADIAFDDVVVNPPLDDAAFAP